MAVRSDFELTTRNAGTVSEICRRLDGIPFAIELAAARVKVLAPEEILARLDDRFRLLTGGSKWSLSHHQTLLETLGWCNPDDAGNFADWQSQACQYSLEALLCSRRYAFLHTEMESLLNLTVYSIVQSHLRAAKRYHARAKAIADQLADSVAQELCAQVEQQLQAEEEVP